jgi:hypothetical protein
VLSARAAGTWLAALAAALTLCAPASAQLSAGPAHVIDGPSANLQSLNGFSVARDGSGGIVYLKDVSGTPHVFVSRLAGGVFQPPEALDSGLGGGSSQPVIAAGNGGLLVIGFISSGQLFAVTRATDTSAWSAPVDLSGGASNPAISITTLGKTYLAFTTAGAGGHDVRCAYYAGGHWGVEASALDASGGDDAGAGSGRPAVAAAGDGVGIVAWGEAGHIITRRVWGTSPSLAYQQADAPTIGGWSEVSADEPAIASGGDSSYAAVVFHETLASGSARQSRVLMQRLHAGIFDGLVQPDGLGTPGAEGADQPQVDAGEYGQGFVLSGRDSSHQLVAMALGGNEVPGGVQRVDSLPNAAMPDGVVTTAGYHSALIAWQQDPGVLASGDIRARFFDGGTLGPEQVLSTAAMGAPQADKGLFAAGDIAADVAAVWVQGTGGATQIVTTQMYEPPGSFGATAPSPYVRTAAPTLVWSAARQLWGPVRYDVQLDGTLVAQTGGTSAPVPNALFPTPLAQGPHTWMVTAVNPAGVSRADRAARFFVDTVKPVVTVKVTGRRRLGSAVHIVIHDSDAPPPLPRSEASGVAQVKIAFGDGKTFTGRRGKYHVYHRARRYTVTVTVTDRAGNSTQVVSRIKIAAKPKPRKKNPHGHH